MTTLFACLWHNTRLNDSGLVGVFTTAQLARRGAEWSESEGDDTPEPIEWSTDAECGIGEGWRGDVTYLIEPTELTDA